MVNPDVVAQAIRFRLENEDSEDARDAVEKTAYTVAYAIRDAVPGFDWEAFLTACGATRFQDAVDRVKDVAAGICDCTFSCADDPASACSLSGSWHLHPGETCLVHPDAAMTP